MERFRGISPHRPLGDSPTEIRIVNLLPGEYGDPIECVLEHIDMDTTKSYEALSYCWGEASITKPILLDSKSYAVTTNLFDGLQRLRKTHSPRRLWIDSLCINQSDLAERSRQVQKMKEIYERALNVVVWLGECRPWSTEAVREVFDFVVELAFACRNDIRDKMIARYGYSKLWQQQRKWIEFIRQHQWFERMWVLQEVAVRPSMVKYRPDLEPLLMCGELKMSFYWLKSSTSFWERLPETHKSLAIGLYPPLDRHLLIHQIHQGHREDHRAQQLGINLEYQLLWYLRLAVTQFRATDPRDRIYALLGLLCGGTLPQHLHPDYQKPMNQVLAEFARFILDGTKALEIIQFRGGKTSNLPSWIPDWTHRPTMVPGNSMCYVQDDFYEVTDQGFLNVFAIRFDFVETTGPTTSSLAKYDEPLEFLQEHIDSVSSFLHLNLDAQGQGSVEDTRTLLKELLVKFDYVMERSRGPLWHQRILDEGLDPLTKIGQPDTVQWHPHPSILDAVKISEVEYGLAEVWRSVAASVEDKAIFTCKGKSMGIMEQKDVQPQPGDLVAAIYGVNCEVVLRPWPEKSSFEIIGQCHRSTRGFSQSMRGFSVADWGKTLELFDFLESLFHEHGCGKITIC
ncbi:heterokaryon incompatibility protein [Apiospora sp. TS-2023a]